MSWLQNSVYSAQKFCHTAHAYDLPQSLNRVCVWQPEWPVLQEDDSGDGEEDEGSEPADGSAMEES